jgi:hypothetical protein
MLQFEERVHRSGALGGLLFANDGDENFSPVGRATVFE